MKTAISFGEIVWDVFNDAKVLGGAPLNFAYYCAKLGINSKIISSVGNDTDGAEAIKLMSGHGVSAEFVQKNAKPTGTVTVSLDKHNNPEYVITKDSAWDFIDFNQVAAKAIANADIFTFGSLAQRSENSRQTLAKFLDSCKSSCLKIFDVNLRQSFYSKEIIAFSLKRANVVKMNEAELKKICDLFKFNGDVLMRAKFIFDAYDLNYLILTRGADGYTIFEKTGMFFGKAVPVKIVDTVGAGDSFLASFISGVLNGKDPEDASEDGAKLAAIVCSRRGAFCLD